MSEQQNRHLLVLGVHLKSEAYPNVLHRVDNLTSHPGIILHEINTPIMNNPSKAIHTKKRLFPGVVRSIFGHINVLARYLFSPYKQTVYVPYPATFVCLTLSLLPGSLKPSRLIIDQFISLYETIVIDRKLISTNGLLARMLFRFEKSALKAADRIIVDTEQNKLHLEKLFSTPQSKIYAIPLSTNENAYSPKKYLANEKVCRVLFIGTLIPLHGIQVIVSAMNILRNNNSIEFTIIGDGQDSKYLEEYLNTSPNNLSWVREWRTPHQLAEEIGKADICLGIFGDTDKANRVCPLKLYSYMSVGRAIITADTDWSRAIDAKVFRTLEPGNAKLLAKEIEQLALDSEERLNLAQAGQDYYRESLCNEISIRELINIIAE